MIFPTWWASISQIASSSSQETFRRNKLQLYKSFFVFNSLNCGKMKILFRKFSDMRKMFLSIEIISLPFEGIIMRFSVSKSFQDSHIRLCYLILFLSPSCRIETLMRWIRTWNSASSWRFSRWVLSQVILHSRSISWCSFSSAWVRSIVA